MLVDGLIVLEEKNDRYRVTGIQFVRINFRTRNTRFDTLFVRVLGGISAAFIMPAVTAYVADITTTEDRPKAMGYVSAAISTGFIIGPGVGGFIADYGIRMPFFLPLLWHS